VRGQAAAVSRRWPLYGLFAGSLISTAGTAMTAVALPWLVLVETGSPARMGVVDFAEMAQYVLVQAVGGPLVDRLRPHRAALLGNLAAAAVIGGIPALYAGGLFGRRRWPRWSRSPVPAAAWPTARTSRWCRPLPLWATCPWSGRLASTPASPGPACCSVPRWPAR
jgi:hypothetical protein